MSAFDCCFEDLMALEGAGILHEIEGDPGGATIWGISHANHPEMWEHGPPDEDEARIFYRDKYWDPLRLGEIGSILVQWEIFECAVNMGTYWATLFAQRAYNQIATIRQVPGGPAFLAEDGRMGSATIQALSSLPGRYVSGWAKLFNYYQCDRYLHMGKRLRERFLLGWLRRV